MNETPSAAQPDHEALRIAIAEKLGWKREVRKMYGGAKNVEGWGLNGHLSLGDPRRQFGQGAASYMWPNWTESADAALLLVEHMRKEGWYWSSDNKEGDCVYAQFVSKDGNVFDATTETLPLAICRAFAKANQIKP